MFFGHGGFGMLGGMLFFWIAIIVLVVFAARGMFRSDKLNEGEHTAATAKEILEQRYARGEITAEQFKQMRNDLQ